MGAGGGDRHHGDLLPELRAALRRHVLPVRQRRGNLRCVGAEPDVRAGHAQLLPQQHPQPAHFWLAQSRVSAGAQVFVRRTGLLEAVVC